jgi:hypothetical protein
MSEKYIRLLYISNEYYNFHKETLDKSPTFKDGFRINNYDELIKKQKRFEEIPDLVAGERNEYSDSFVEIFKNVFKNYKGECNIIFENFTSEFCLDILFYLLQGWTLFFPEKYGKKEIDSIIIITKEKYTEVYKDRFGHHGFYFFLHFSYIFKDLNHDFEY